MSLAWHWTNIAHCLQDIILMALHPFCANSSVEQAGDVIRFSPDIEVSSNASIRGHVGIYTKLGPVDHLHIINMQLDIAARTNNVFKLNR